MTDDGIQHTQTHGGEGYHEGQDLPLLHSTIMGSTSSSSTGSISDGCYQSAAGKVNQRGSHFL